MAHELNTDRFIANSRSFPVLDVRSPSEFKQGHIPGAFSLPLFDDNERAKVGSLYKQEGRQKALKKGLDIVGPKMRYFVEKAEELSNPSSNNMLVHCWRGGMRSESMGWLLETAGFRVSTLNGGYKAFRNWVLNYFDKPFTIILVGGYTGSGKSELLANLSKKGEQILDLEAHAHHKGSVFGHLGESEQPTGEQFENNLAYELDGMNSAHPIWIEDESRLIGQRCLPEDLYRQMGQAPLICVDIPEARRIERLVKEYAIFGDEQLKESINKISKRLGGLRTRRALEAIEQKEYKEAARITLTYYDKVYQYGLDSRKSYSTIELDDPSDPNNAELLRNHAYALIHSKTG